MSTFCCKIIRSLSTCVVSVNKNHHKSTVVNDSECLSRNLEFVFEEVSSIGVVNFENIDESESETTDPLSQCDIESLLEVKSEVIDVLYDPKHWKSEDKKERCTEALFKSDALPQDCKPTPLSLEGFSVSKSLVERCKLKTKNSPKNKEVVQYQKQDVPVERKQEIDIGEKSTKLESEKPKDVETMTQVFNSGLDQKMEPSKKLMVINCGNCNKVCRSLAILENHECTEPQFKCNKCPFGAQNLFGLKRHQLLNHPTNRKAEQTSSIKKISCKNCNKAYKDIKSLEQHQQLVCGQKPRFFCPHCPFRAKQKGNLQTHIWCKHTVKSRSTKFSCENCGKSYTHKMSLKRHQRINCGKEPELGGAL